MGVIIQPGDHWLHLPRGKGKPRYDPKTPLFSHFVDPFKLAPPKGVNYWGGRSKRAGLHMHLNDVQGCCVPAAAANIAEELTADTSSPIVIPDTAVETAYEVVGGFNPLAPLDAEGNNPTDNGCIALDFLKYWHDVGIGGHKIEGWLSLEPGNIVQAKQTIDLFGSLFIGNALPVTIRSQPLVWAVVANAGPDGQPNSLGGHMTMATGYNDTYYLFRTWATEIWATWEWYVKYVDEVYAIYSKDWMSVGGLTPAGFDEAGALAAMQALAA